MLLLLIAFVITFSRQNSKLQTEISTARMRLNWIESTAKNLDDGHGVLHVYAMKNTDGLLATFAGRMDVEMISLENTDMTGEGLQTIANMPNVRAIEFVAGEYGVNDETISILAKCTILTNLDLSGGYATAAIQRLKTQLPNCTMGPFSMRTVAEQTDEPEHSKQSVLNP